MQRLIRVGIRTRSGLPVFGRGISSSSMLRFAVITENVPALGESITEGALASWTKEVGESVQVDDVVAVIETDKVSVDIKSPFAGVLVEQLAALDDTVSSFSSYFLLSIISFSFD
jgi:hypothetical protein